MDVFNAVAPTFLSIGKHSLPYGKFFFIFFCFYSHPNHTDCGYLIRATRALEERCRQCKIKKKKNKKTGLKHNNRKAKLFYSIIDRTSEKHVFGHILVFFLSRRTHFTEWHTGLLDCKLSSIYT